MTSSLEDSKEVNGNLVSNLSLNMALRESNENISQENNKHLNRESKNKIIDGDYNKKRQWISQIKRNGRSTTLEKQDSKLSCEINEVECHKVLDASSPTK